MRVTIPAILKEVNDPVSKNEVRMQFVILERPVRDQFTGEVTFTDYYPATIFNKDIERLNAATLLGEKVKAECFIGSSAVKRDDNTFHNIRLKIINISKIETPYQAVSDSV